MTDHLTRRAKELFLDAAELGGAEREAFLERLREEEPELFERVQRLLAADEEGRREVPQLFGALRDSLLAEMGASGGRAGAMLGDYELLEEVAAGASGVVFRARQVSLDRVVAVKILRGGRFASSKDVERFRAEAEAVARLDDPQIVPIYEVGDSEAGPFFSMKWIEGGSLADASGRYVGDPRAAAELLVQVAQAVHHAHQRGILHRDLKPSNILMDAAGTPYVADFGIAKRLDGEAGGTATVGIAGTPAYMAPEQTSTREEFTVATDVWALGAVLHELLGGRPAFPGDSITDVLQRVCNREPEPLPPGVPRDLVTIVHKCLTREPARRYASAWGLAADLERWLNREPILARRTSTPERLLLWARRRPLVAGLCALVAVLVVALAVGASWASLRLSDQLERITEAEAEGRERLRSSLLAQARDRRHGERAGRRGRALELIRQAAELRPGPDLRDEAIACLAVFDLVVERDWPLPAGGARVIAFDGELGRFVTSSSAGELVVADVAGGPEPLRLPGFGPAAWVAVFSADGRRLAVRYHGPAAADRPILGLWDLESAERLITLPAAANAMEFHPAGERLVVAQGSGVLTELDAESGEVLRERELPGSPYRAAFDPGGERLAVCTYPEKTLSLYTWPGLEEIFGIECERTVFDLEWTHDGASLLYGSSDQRTHVLDVATAEVTRTFTGHRSDVVRVMLSPVAPLIATHSWDGTSRLWDLVTGEELLTMEARVMGFGRDGRLAFQNNERAGIWRVDPEPVRRTLHGHTGKSPTRVEFSPDGRLLVSAGPGELLFWDPVTARRLRRLELEGAGVAFFHPDGRLFAITSGVGVLAWRLPEDPEALVTAALAPQETLLEGNFKSAHLTPDGRILSALAGRRIILRWLDGSRPDRVIEGFAGANRPRVDPSGRWLACGSWKSPDVKVRVWDLETGEPAVDLCPEAGSVHVSFSPDGERLVAGSGPTYRIFRVGSWEEVRVLERPIELGTGPNDAAFGPGGTLLVEDVDSAVRLHDLDTGVLIARFEPPDAVAAGPLAIDPTGRFLAVGSSNNRIELWDVERIRARLAELGLEGAGPWPAD